jgi:hypothetical protein
MCRHLSQAIAVAVIAFLSGILMKADPASPGVSSTPGAMSIPATRMAASHPANVFEDIPWYARSPESGRVIYAEPPPGQNADRRPMVRAAQIAREAECTAPEEWNRLCHDSKTHGIFLGQTMGRDGRVRLLGLRCQYSGGWSPDAISRGFILLIFVVGPDGSIEVDDDGTRTDAERQILASRHLTVPGHDALALVETGELDENGLHQITWTSGGISGTVWVKQRDDGEFELKAVPN